MPFDKLLAIYVFVAYMHTSKEDGLLCVYGVTNMKALSYGDLARWNCSDLNPL